MVAEYNSVFTAYTVRSNYLQQFLYLQDIIPHMGLHGLIPYEKLKGLLGGMTSKSFEPPIPCPLTES